MSLRRHLSFANVMSLVAVFIALGAGAYAAGLGRNSVKSKQIKDGRVAAVDLADGAVDAAKLADGSIATPKLDDGSVNNRAKVDDGSLTGADFGDDSLTGADITEASLQGVTATSADTSGGLQVKKIDYRNPIQNGVVRNVVTFPNIFRIDAQCANVQDGLDITAFTAVDNSKISMIAKRGILADDNNGAADVIAFSDDSFNANEGFAIDNHLADDAGGSNDVVIQYSTPAGFTATIDVATAELASGCTITGTAIGG